MSRTSGLRLRLLLRLSLGLGLIVVLISGNICGPIGPRRGELQMSIAHDPSDGWGVISTDPSWPGRVSVSPKRGRPATGAKSAAERKRAERARKKEKGDGILSD